MVLRAWLLSLVLFCLAVAVAATLYQLSVLRAFAGERPLPRHLLVLGPLAVGGCLVASLVWAVIALGGR
jgi:hypothetical protein